MLSGADEGDVISIEIDKSVKDLIASKGIDKAFGARPLRRTIQNILEDSLAEEILDLNIKSGESIIVDVENEKIITIFIS